MADNMNHYEIEKLNKENQSICEKTITIKWGDLFPRIKRQDTNRHKLLRYSSSGVYVLWYKNKIVYVGQSKNVKQRLYSHKKKNWKWNQISYINAELEYERRMIEAMLINYYQPIYNKESINESHSHSIPFTRFN